MTLVAYPELSVYNSIIKQAANPGAIPKSISNAAVNDNTDVSCYDKKTVKKKIICKRQRLGLLKHAWNIEGGRTVFGSEFTPFTVLFGTLS